VAALVSSRRGEAHVSGDGTTEARVSDTAQGAGWWQASDGRWYPPEQHPDARAALPPPGAAPMGPPAFGTPVPGAAGVQPPRSGLSTAQKVLIGVVVVVVLGLGGCAVLVGTVAKRGAKALVGKNDCSFLPAREAASVIPGKPSMLELSGLSALAGVALDDRVLPRAPSCMFTPGDGQRGPTGRVARLRSGDAAKTFAAEVTKAKGLKEDKGNGLSVETEAYYATSVSAGDEAFCTSSGLPPSSGVLVRKGDTLVYVSLLPDEAQLKDIGVAGSGQAGTLNYDEANCALAQKFAAAVLGR